MCFTTSNGLRCRDSGWSHVSFHMEQSHLGNNLSLPIKTALIHCLSDKRFSCFVRFLFDFKVVGHVILATTLWTRAKSVDLSSKTEITSCYMFIWKVRLAINQIFATFFLLLSISDSKESLKFHQSTHFY